MVAKAANFELQGIVAVEVGDGLFLRDCTLLVAFERIEVLQVARFQLLAHKLIFAVSHTVKARGEDCYRYQVDDGHPHESIERAAAQIAPDNLRGLWSFMQLRPYLRVEVLMLDLASPTCKYVPEAQGNTHRHRFSKFSDAVHALELDEGHHWLRLPLAVLRYQRIQLLLRPALNLIQLFGIVTLVQPLLLGIHLLHLEVLGDRQQ